VQPHLVLLYRMHNCTFRTIVLAPYIGLASVGKLEYGVYGAAANLSMTTPLTPLRVASPTSARSRSRCIGSCRTARRSSMACSSTKRAAGVSP